MDAVMGKNKYLQAALKSLPFQQQQQGGSDAADDDKPLPPMPADERKLAEALLQQVSGWQDAAPSSLEQDEQRLQALRAAGQDADARLVAAVRYRAERKKLLLAAASVLKAYTRG